MEHAESCELSLSAMRKCPGNLEVLATTATTGDASMMCVNRKVVQADHTLGALSPRCSLPP